MKARLLKKLRKQASEVYLKFNLNEAGNYCCVRLPYPKGKEYLQSEKGEDAILFSRKWKDGEIEYGFVPYEDRDKMFFELDEHCTLSFSFRRNFVHDNKNMILNCALRFLLYNHISYCSSRKVKLVK